MIGPGQLDVALEFLLVGIPIGLAELVCNQSSQKSGQVSADALVLGI